MLWCARSTLPAIEAVVAVLRRGAVLVPLSPSATAAELDHVIGDARPVLALFDQPRPEASRGGLSVMHIDDLARAGCGGRAGGAFPTAADRATTR